MKRNGKVLILTVGYGQGHRAAAAALDEAFVTAGYRSQILDPLTADRTGMYSLSLAYYKLCVRRAPWLWAVTYSRTDTADWSHHVTWPCFRSALNVLADTVVSWRPDVVICTYPLFAYMLDYLNETGRCRVPYAVVVTDSLEISRPWLRSQTPLLFVPDEHSRQLVVERYGIHEQIVYASGFPVRRAFKCGATEKEMPTETCFRIVYGAYLSIPCTVLQVRRILHGTPGVQMVLLAGDRVKSLRRHLASFIAAGVLHVIAGTDEMAELFHWAHVYIGKTGAATMFECYASGVPMLVNFALPGQEQGNLDLLLRDGAGVKCSNTRDLCATLHDLQQNGYEKWKMLRRNQLSRPERSSGAKVIVDVLEQFQF